MLELARDMQKREVRLFWCPGPGDHGLVRVLVTGIGAALVSRSRASCGGPGMRWPGLTGSAGRMSWTWRRSAARRGGCAAIVHLAAAR